MSSSLCLQMVEKSPFADVSIPGAPSGLLKSLKAEMNTANIKKREIWRDEWIKWGFLPSSRIRGASRRCWDQTSLFTRAERDFMMMFSKWLIRWVIHSPVIKQHISFVSISFLTTTNPNSSRMRPPSLSFFLVVLIRMRFLFHAISTAGAEQGCAAAIRSPDLLIFYMAGSESRRLVTSQKERLLLA